MMATTQTNVIPCATPISEAWSDIMGADEIVPGHGPSYELCKSLFLYHPLCLKIVEQPVSMALSQKRVVSIEGAPDEVLEQFEITRKKLRLDYYIKNTEATKRIYGVASLVCGTIGKSSAQPLEPADITVEKIYFAVMDPLNTAGSIVIDQNPNSEMYQRVGDITVAGVPWHRSRSCVTFRGMPIYIAYTTSAFGFVGRSVFQSALYPLKSFLETMRTDDLVAKKAGLIIALMKATGSIVNALQQAAASIKRFLLKQGGNGEVLGITSEDKIESLDLKNLEGPATMARTNIIKNIATAVPMPAQIIEQESFAAGFTEGVEDTKNVVRYVSEVRDELEPLYMFTDPIAQRAAWTPEFCETIRAKYPEVWGKKTANEMFYAWSNAFKASWPNLLEEPESEKAKSEKVKMEGAVAIVDSLKPMANEEGQKSLVNFLVGNVNSWRNLFPVPLDLNPDDFTKQMPEPGELGAPSEGADPEETSEPASGGKLRAVK